MDELAEQREFDNGIEEQESHFGANLERPLGHMRDAATQRRQQPLPSTVDDRIGKSESVSEKRQFITLSRWELASRALFSAVGSVIGYAILLGTVVKGQFDLYYIARLCFVGAGSAAFWFMFMFVRQRFLAGPINISNSRTDGRTIRSLLRQIQWLLIIPKSNNAFSHVVTTDWVIRSLSYWIPRRYRESIMGDIYEDCAELRGVGASEFRVKIHAVWQIFLAVVVSWPAIMKASLWAAMGKWLIP